MKRVLISITSLFGGGAERVAAFWANHLQKAGYDVHVLVLYRGDREYDLEPTVPVHALAESFQEYLEMGKLTTLRKLRAAIKEIKPEVNLSLLPRMQEWFFLASFGLKLKRIETVRVNPWMAVPNKLEERLWKLTFLKADRIIVQTPGQQPYFSRKVQEKCVCIPNPISESFLIEAKKTWSPLKSFVALGRLIERKNYGMMVKAFAKVAGSNPEVSLTVYGAGEDGYVSQLKGLITELGMEKQIFLKGWTKDSAAALGKADGFLLASDFEGFPNALMEAMALGLVCIATRCPTGPEDLIEDGKNGFLVKVRDEEELEGALRKVLSLDAGQVAEIGQAAHDSISFKCDGEKVISLLIEVIER